MKRAITPTSVERVMREGDFIVSKTDRKGIITYGNPIFIEFSGFREDELIGTQHNIIRHPDMPRSAFKLVWDTIQSGKEVFAYVKNMSKDGGYYWVFAHITPGSAVEVVDLASAIGGGAKEMEDSMGLVALAQRARADASEILNGNEVSVTSLSQMEQKAVTLARSRKWVKGSADREALVEIYDRLFEGIEARMH